MIRDGKEMYLPDEIICRPCSEESYFKVLAPTCKDAADNSLVEETVS